MQILLRLLRRKAGGVTERQDSALESDRITIGSAADRNIQLLGPGIEADHAVIACSAGQFSITARRGAVVKVRGTECSSSPLAIGDVVEIGGHRLTLIQAPGSFDIGIQLEPDEKINAADFERAFRTDITQTWLSNRKLAWSLLALVLVLGFGVPLASTLIARSAPEVAAPAADSSKAAGPDRFVLQPSDAFWSTGILTEAHRQNTGNDCKTCHQSFFTPVRDAECKACHTRIVDHVDTSHPPISGLPAKEKCATCHREHDAPNNSVVIRADRLCTDCHGNTKVQFDSSSLGHVTGFSAQKHPSFEASLLVPKPKPGGKALELTWETVRTVLKGATETTNLVFSHEFHLGGAPVEHRTERRSLQCGDCHQPEANGEHFVPVSMSKTCSGCHKLEFDEFVSNRQLPHGDENAAVATLEDYFVRKAVDPSRVPDLPEIVRTLPGEQGLQRKQDKCDSSSSPLTCGLGNAQTEILHTFEQGGKVCGKCHEVTDTQIPQLHGRFRITPVRLVRDYFPDTRFSHRSHQRQGERTGDDACVNCHEMARTSNNSAQLMMPDVGKCLSCHREYPEREKVELRCMSCHTYHPVTTMAATQAPQPEQQGESTSQ